MKAAIRWLGDSLRGRTAAWADGGVRLRVFVIAGIFLIGNASALADDLRSPPSIAPAMHVAGDVICIAAAIGLVFRSRFAYGIAFIYTFVFGVSAASGIIWIPILAVVSGDVQFSWPVDGELIEEVLMLAWIALLVFGVWQYWWVWEKMRRIGERWQAPLYGLVIAGAAIVVAWSIANGIAPSLVAGWLAMTQIDPWIRLTLFAVVLLLVYSYAMWSYATLRSRPVREAFDLP